jgi:hypothetical protein
VCVCVKWGRGRWEDEVHTQYERFVCVCVCV